MALILVKILSLVNQPWCCQPVSLFIAQVSDTQCHRKILDIVTNIQGIHLTLDSYQSVYQTNMINLRLFIKMSLNARFIKVGAPKLEVKDSNTHTHTHPPGCADIQSQNFCVYPALKIEASEDIEDKCYQWYIPSDGIFFYLSLNMTSTNRASKWPIPHIPLQVECYPVHLFTQSEDWMLSHVRMSSLWIEET